MKIVDIKTHVLVEPDLDRDATSGAQDAIVVEIVTDEGLVGLGETDLNAWIARACIEAPGTHTMDRGLRESLIGQDPLVPHEIWDALYRGSAMSGRRGAVVHALGALDMALWDICGKAAGVPCWQLWGRPPVGELIPYASLQPEVGSFDEYRDSIAAWAVRAKEAGFRACKLEATFSGPYVHKNLHGPDEHVAEVIRAVRAKVGPDMVIMVDVQYAFDSVERTLRAIESWSEFDVYFLEAPIWPDDLDDYARLCAASELPIASGEWLATRYEFESLIRYAGVQVVQPDVGRVGGLTEALRVIDLAVEHERIVIPHAWKTGITASATAHLALVSPATPFFEFLPPELCESSLRKDLVEEEIQFRDGVVDRPSKPGLGVELNLDALEYFERAAKALRA